MSLSLRLKRGLTQQQLGGKVGMTQGNLSDYELSHRPIENTTLGTALRLCDALRVANPRRLPEDDAPSE